MINESLGVLNAKKIIRKSYLIKRFANIFDLCDRDINRYILLWEMTLVTLGIPRKDLMKHHCPKKNLQ